MRILVLNCGSSSLRFQVIATDAARIREDRDRRLVRGRIERIGGHSLVTVERARRPRVQLDLSLPTHRAAVDRLLRWLVSGDSGIDEIDDPADIDAVGHRVVHGGERFSGSVRVDREVRRAIEACIDLAPLHNPANLKGIRAVEELLGPDVPQVAVFDTAFHASMPEPAYLYGIPYQYYRRHRIRRYGFHGTSHRYVAYRYRTLVGVPRERVNIITLHLGNGCSACAIRGGDSVDTSMGFTPLEGLMMGTRSGDIDPSVVDYLSHKEGVTVTYLIRMLNKQSGLLGVSGLTSDVRELLAEEAESGDRRAHLALDLFCYRVRKYIGAYHAALGGADAVVFTGGIGENAPEIRRRVTNGLKPLGIEIDDTRNEAVVGGRSAEIGAEGAAVRAFVIPTDEELLIARDTFRVVAAG